MSRKPCACFDVTITDLELPQNDHWLLAGTCQHHAIWTPLDMPYFFAMIRQDVRRDGGE
jgi:hypothetical protein